MILPKEGKPDINMRYVSLLSLMNLLPTVCLPDTEETVYFCHMKLCGLNHSLRLLSGSNLSVWLTAIWLCWLIVMWDEILAACAGHCITLCRHL